MLDCNQGLLDLTGYSYAEVITMDGLLFVAPEVRELSRERVLAGDEKPYETTGLRKDGSRYPVRIEARNIPYQGKMARVVEFRDITEAKQAEEALQHELLRRRILMERSQDGIVILEGDHVVVEANERFAAMLGYTREEVRGLHSWDFDAVLTKAAILESFTPLPLVNRVFETRHRRKDGSIFDVEVERERRVDQLHAHGHLHLSRHHGTQTRAGGAATGQGAG